VCVDETHFFRIMANLTSMLGLLQHIKGKPYDYGLVTYMAAQTLLFTGLSVATTWTGQPPTPPIEAVLILLARLPNETSVHFGPQALIADSLWSHPAHLDRFRQHGIRYTVAVKENNTLLARRPLLTRYEGSPCIQGSHLHKWVSRSSSP
jgi:hypothetical protein